MLKLNEFFNLEKQMPHQLPDFTKASILVIGDIMLDRYWFGETARISPEAPVPVVKIQQMDERPGGAGNVALNIAALGGKVTLLGLTGDDKESQTLKTFLTAANVNHDLLAISHAPTITKLRIISRRQQLIRLDFEEKLANFNTDLLIETYKKHLPHCNLVILSDYHKGTLHQPQTFIQLAKEAGIPIIIDPKGTDFKKYHGADVITPNFKEFEAVVGTCKNEQEILQKAHQFLNENEINTMLLTRGERGMTLIQKNNEELHLPAYGREIIDVTGAGDTVIGVLGSALSAGTTLPHAMSLANLAASIVVSKLGAGTVKTVELEAVLNSHQNTTEGGIFLNDEQLLLAITTARMQGKKIIFTNGCFDLLHPGHVDFLQQVKQLGDFLIVAINDDASIKKLKGPTRPIHNIHHRMMMLANLEVVDAVIAFADDTPNRLLKYLKPDVLIKGGDYNLDQVVGAEIVHAYGGEVRIVLNTQDFSTSTSEIIDRIKKEDLSA
jgi:D-beta-D-heptose 7-phosphate kinase/D-beta-D-heptose 1-phosphate adenosyltransferase